MKLDQTIEAILFVGAKPFAVKRLAEITKHPVADVQDALLKLGERLETSGSGVVLQNNGQSYELVTHPETSEVVADVINEETSGELTRPQLEALAILAYCGPMTRPELEQIRGIQSSLILRNLMLRGLVEENEDTRLGQSAYAVTFDFLNHLGMKNVEALPDYSELHGHSSVNDVLRDLEEKPAEPIC